MLKKYGLFLLLIALSFAAGAQNDGYKYTEASDLTLVGKLFPDTPNPYHRVDTVKYKGFTKSENRQVRESSGISVAFRTDSKAIRIKTVFGDVENPSNTMGISANGYDLYILQDGRWLWAGSGPRNGKYDEVTVVSDLNGEMHECLLYLPTFREELSVKVGVVNGSVLEAIPNPFRYRIGISDPASPTASAPPAAE
jgi:hypothetical protein